MIIEHKLVLFSNILKLNYFNINKINLKFCLHLNNLYMCQTVTYHSLSILHKCFTIKTKLTFN